MSSSDVFASAETEMYDKMFEEGKYSCNSNTALWKLYIGTSRFCNAELGPYSAIAELGTFFHKIFNGFWTHVVAFHSLRWPQHSLGTKALYRHL
jgi:hypothetical protein